MEVKPKVGTPIPIQTQLSAYCCILYLVLQRESLSVTVCFVSHKIIIIIIIV